MLKQYSLHFLLLFTLLFNTYKEKGHHQSLITSAFNELASKTKEFNVQQNGVTTNNYTKNLKIASWNIRDLGRTKTPEDIHQIATILRDFDVVALQEVVAKDPAGAQAVAKIVDELNRMGYKWDYRISDPTKSPSVYMSERYAFLWKTSRATLLGKAYLDKDLEDLCYREPFVAKFKAKDKVDSFVIVNYHSRKYYDKPEEEIIHFIDYPERLNTSKVIILGDFNISEQHPVWNPFYSKGFKSALKNEATTLKTKCKTGEYLNHAIDNAYFYSGITVVKAGKVDFVTACENLEAARKISDHLPIYIELKPE